MNPLNYKLTLRYKYYLYLFTFCLVSSISVQAQFSEEDLERQANELFDSGRYAEAMPLYSQLLSLNPTNPVYNYKYGATALYGDADKKEEAVKFLKFATKKGGVDNKSWYFLGRAYHLNYQFADAIRAYEKYKENASGKEVEDLDVDRHLESARNGLNLLSKIKDVKVLDKKLTAYESFFRVYELGEIGGKILVTPDELLTSLDKKNNHKSLIHFRGTGTTVYFSSYGKDGKTGLDIYKAEVLPGGTFSEPIKLGGFVNTNYDEDYPFMHPDGKTFYFSSTGHSSMGGFDIFKSYYDTGMDVFSQPENLDFAINTPDDELFYIADTAKKMANFASARGSKQGELHVYKVLVQSNSVELTLIKGSFINKINSNDKLAKIAVVDASTNEKVSEQYTDPSNGDYVVSVPRSGKYKFVVEVQNSDKVHAGLVDVPRSAGVKAYVQEMELVLSAGVEKLLINNKFDETYEGDVLALAKDLLRKQAELDVNFNPETETIPEVVPQPEEDFSLVYKDAGFPAGMDNDKVLEFAENRVAAFNEAIKTNEENRARAIDVYIRKTAAANIMLTEAQDLVARAKASEGNEKDKLMFQAAVKKTESRELSKEARSANELAIKLGRANKDLTNNLGVVSSHHDSLQSAIQKKDYALAKSLMQKENSIQKGEMEAYNVVDVENAVLQSSIEAKERADKMMNQSLQLREEADALNTKLLTRKRQLEKAKGKEAKELEEEISLIENELSDIENSIQTSFERAGKSQELSDSEARQYEMFSTFTNSESSLSQEEQAEILSTETSDSELTDLEENFQNLEIDPESVSQYAQNNPEAFKAYNPLMRKQIAAAYLSPEENTETESAEALAESISSITEEDKAVSPESGEEGSDTEKSVSETELANNSEEEIAEKTDLNGEQENAENVYDDDASLLAEESGDHSGSNSEIPRNIQEKTANQKVEAEVSPSKQIEAEKIKIKAAQDWLLIIDGSIAELEQGMGGEADEDVETQLQDYRDLRKQKLAEIEASESLIAELNENAEVVPGEKIAIKNAEKDLGGLSNAQVASLESKVAIASSDIEYIRDLKEVDPDYIPELTSAELSGLSDPEIASKRIELNKKLLVSLDKLINEEEGSSELSEERLKELRRIKLLELKEDEQVAIGAVAYQARTTEAKDYQNLISEEVDEEVNDEQNDLSSLSPKMQEDLTASFSRSLVMDGFDSEMSKYDQSVEDSLHIAKRLSLRKSYLNQLQSEISFYSQTIESQGQNAPEELKDRYSELLSDRSKIADEIQEDQALLTQVSQPKSTTASEEIASNQTPETAIDLPTKAEITQGFDQKYQTELAKIKSDDLSESAELKAIAQLQNEQSKEADSLVVAYIEKLDQSTSPQEKDQIQQLIQSLDAIAADKKQEADRLMYESDILTSAEAEIAEMAENSGSEDLPVSREIKSDEIIPFENLSYKSLNANIAFSKLEPRVNSLNASKAELADLVETYNASDNTDERIQLNSQIESKEADIQALENALILDVSESNAAEIAYYQKANDQMLKSIESNFSKDADLVEYSERAAEISEMLSKNEIERSQNKKSESEYILDELALIMSLSDLNKDMDSFIQSESRGEESLATMNTESSGESPYELLMRNPTNHQPVDGSKYISPMFKQVESSLTETRKSEVLKSAPELDINSDFADTKNETTKKKVLANSTSVDSRGYELLKSDPAKLNYVLSAVTADSLKTLELQNASISKVKSQSANEKYAEAARLRNMVVHQNTNAEKELVKKRADKLEKEAELDLEIASIAAKSAEDLRIKRLQKEEQLASDATQLSSSELNELNALLRKETYTIVPNVDLGREEVAAAIEIPEETTAAETTIPVDTKKSTSEGYSKDEMNLFNSARNWLAVVEIIGEKDDFSDVEESLFLESEKSAYSAKNPIPIDPLMPDGLIFQVQVGAFRNPIPQDLYKEFAPVMGQRLNNGITRYRAGLFRVYSEAKETRDLIRQKGYNDAFVVVYVDGERLTGAQARDILAQAREMEEAEKTDTQKISSAGTKDIPAEKSDLQTEKAKPVKTADYYNDPEAADARQVEITQGLFYTVQVGVYSKPVKLDKLFNLTELNSELTESGYIRYTSGRYTDLQSASSRKNLVVNKGVTDAFITAYYNGKRISLNEAKSILAEKGNSVLFNEIDSAGLDKSQDESGDQIEYIVIMGIMSGDIPQELAALFEENKDWKIQKTIGPAGQEMYVSPKFKSRKEATEFLNLARESGVESAIMGKMVNGSIAEVDIEN